MLVVGQRQACAAEEGPLSLGGGEEGEPGEPPLLVSFPSSNQQAFTEGLR